MLAKKQRPQQDSPATDTPASSNAAPANGFQTGNQARQEQIEQASSMNEGQAFDEATASGGSAIPFQAHLEKIFDADLSQMKAFMGLDAQMGEMNANGAARGDKVAFAGGAPSLELVTHEVVHYLQGQNKGGGGEQGVSDSSESAELEARTIAQQVAAGKTPAPITQSLGSSAVHRDSPGYSTSVIEVDVSMSPGDMSDDIVNTMLAIIDQAHTALQNFETVVNQNSAEEAVPKDPGLIALEKFGDFVFGKVSSFGASLVPGGALALEATTLLHSVSSAIDTERQRSSNAQASNQLANFITSLRTTITTHRSNLLSNKVETRNSVEENITSGSFGHARVGMLRDNVESSRTGDCSISSLFNQISGDWISQTTSSDGSSEGEIIIKMDKNWELVSAYIDAPRGSRLGEQLVRQSGGSIDLDAIPCKRTVEYLFAYPGTGLGAIVTEITAEGSIGTFRAVNSVATQSEVEEMVDFMAGHLTTTGLPTTSRITGTTTP